jgi:hypothetical protein
MATAYNTSTYTMAPYASTTSNKNNVLDTSLTYTDPAMASLSATQLPSISPHLTPANLYAREAAYMSSLPTPAEIAVKTAQASGIPIATPIEEKKKQITYRKTKIAKANAKRLSKIAKASKITMDIVPVNKKMGSLKNIKLLKLKNMDNMIKISKIAKVIKRGSK